MLQATVSSRILANGLSWLSCDWGGRFGEVGGAPRLASYVSPLAALSDKIAPPCIASPAASKASFANFDIAPTGHEHASFGPRPIANCMQCMAPGCYTMQSALRLAGSARFSKERLWKSKRLVVPRLSPTPKHTTTAMKCNVSTFCKSAAR